MCVCVRVCVWSRLLPTWSGVCVCVCVCVVTLWFLVDVSALSRLLYSDAISWAQADLWSQEMFWRIYHLSRKATEICLLFIANFTSEAT